MVDKQVELEQAFKDGLDNLVLLAGKLKPYCSTVDELIDMVELAKINDGQAKLLLSLCTGKK